MAQRGGQIIEAGSLEGRCQQIRWTPSTRPHGAQDPVAMARAMKLAVESGRLAYRSGRMGLRRYADPSSPLAGLI